MSWSETVSVLVGKEKGMLESKKEKVTNLSD